MVASFVICAAASVLPDVSKTLREGHATLEFGLGVTRSSKYRIVFDNTDYLFYQTQPSQQTVASLRTSFAPSEHWSVAAHFMQFGGGVEGKPADLKGDVVPQWLSFGLGARWHPLPGLPYAEPYLLSALEIAMVDYRSDDLEPFAVTPTHTSETLYDLQAGGGIEVPLWRGLQFFLESAAVFNLYREAHPAPIIDATVTTAETPDVVLPGFYALAGLSYRV
jgi:hypothetical protein